MDPNQPPMGGAPGGAAPGGAPGGGAPPEQGGGDQAGAQLQQIAQQYVSQGRPPELAQQGMDMLCQLMGLDGGQGGTPPGQGGGPPGAGAGAPPPGGGAPPAGGDQSGAPTMRNGGKLQSFKSKAKKAEPAASGAAVVPVLRIPGK